MGLHQGSVLSPFLLALVVDLVTKFVRKGVLSELLCANDLVRMSETIDGLRDKFLKLKVFESKRLKVNLGKTQVMVSCGITMDSLAKTKFDPCGVCILNA